MNKKELIQSFLEKMGYPFKEDSDGDLEVTYQMKEIYIILSGDEEAYVSMLLPFHSVEEDKITFELAVCNRLNRMLKNMKMFVDESLTMLSASFDFYYANEESLEENLRRGFHALAVARSIYYKESEKLSED
ncbi:MAG: YbjN domain-containing protein [Oscillospiraceae bacterium]|nr:YbjN domain-containing protein [Oscillospiraceae bacterium]